MKPRRANRRGPSGREAARAAASHFEERQRRIARERLSRIAAIRAVIPQFIKAFPGVELVSIVGSAAAPAFYRSGSDVDLVVKGLGSGEVLRASAFLERRLGVPLDLIPWEDIPCDKRHRLKGRTVYEAK